LSSDEHITELSEAARRAGYIVTEQIDSIIERAEQQAEAIRRQAERDAEDTRREAVAAAKRLLDRIHALEFPLGELVVSLRDEMDGVSRQLEAGEHVDSHATALPPMPEPEPAHRAPDPEATTRQGDPEISTDEFESEPPVHPEPDFAAEDDSIRQEQVSREPAQKRRPSQAARAARERRDEEDEDKGNVLIRRRAKSKTKGAFISVEGHCAVCHRSFKAGSASALEQSGWQVNGDVGLCPDCQADRWELPEGARLPVRPGGA
jgi:hypothetical protein